MIDPLTVEVAAGAVTGPTAPVGLAPVTGPAPTLDPDRRDPADVCPTDSYRPADPVWVYRAGAWCTGIVEAASALAATVTYRPATVRGTAVDTLTARFLLPRTQPDPALEPGRSPLDVHPALRTRRENLNRTD